MIYQSHEKARFAEKRIWNVGSLYRESMVGSLKRTFTNGEDDNEKVLYPCVIDLGIWVDFAPTDGTRRNGCIDRRSDGNPYV
jgi:hypothetical protein